MKKKKPKKSPAKSSPKSSPAAKSQSPPVKSNSPPAKSSSTVTDPILLDSMNGSDAQIGDPAAADAHLSKDSSDPHPVAEEVKTDKTVIVASPTDPSSVCNKEVTEVVSESSSEAPLVPTAVDSVVPPNAIPIMSELSSAAPLDFSKTDSACVKDPTESVFVSKDVSGVEKTQVLDALSDSSGRLPSDTTTSSEAQENAVLQIVAPVSVQMEVL
ncbi:unnamed protein product, partial [Brassica rapa]